MAAVVAVTSDAILVAEDWISEHYFTTDAKKESFTARVLARRKEWDAGKDDGTPRTRLVAARQELLSTFATLSNDTEASVTSELNERLAAILGYGAVGYAVERQRAGDDSFAARASTTRFSRSSMPARPPRSRTSWPRTRTTSRRRS